MSLAMQATQIHQDLMQEPMLALMVEALQIKEISKNFSHEIF
jgi:hypothetical protein